MRRVILLLVSALGACATNPAATPQPQEHIDWIAPGVDTAAALLPRDSIYPPTLRSMPLPPLPSPPSVIGSRINALFVIGARGNIERISFAALPDRAYTQVMLRHFRSFEFRPGVRLDGTPTRALYAFSWTFVR